MRMPRLSRQGKTRAGNIIAVVLLLAGLVGTYQFFWRSLGSFVTLRSAYELGVPSASTIRAWMTLDYVAGAYDVPVDTLIAGLDLPADTSSDTPLFKIARERDIPRIEMVRETQVVIASDGGTSSDSELDSSTTHDTFLAALLAYSYPALGLILLIGAIGAPVPTGFATVLAGVLSADGSMVWPVAVGVAIVASVSGDVIGYGIGRTASERFISRYGRYMGYAGERKAKIEWLFYRWGGVTVLLTRTLVSHLSSVASLLAGISRYSLSAFLGFAVVGRVLWTAAYFGAGYFVGTDIEASSSFLGNVTGLAISALIVVISAYHLFWRKGIKAAEARL